MRERPGKYKVTLSTKRGKGSIVACRYAFEVYFYLAVEFN